MARFLVIDDDNMLRELMVMTLENNGHGVVSAASGEEALAIFDRQPIDVIVTDLLMPDDGIAAVVELKQRHPDVPLIVVSGLALHSPRHREVMQLLGAARVMPKPFRLLDFR